MDHAGLHSTKGRAHTAPLIHLLYAPKLPVNPLIRLINVNNRHYRSARSLAGATAFATISPNGPAVRAGPR
jgi:hypothetical protein